VSPDDDASFPDSFNRFYRLDASPFKDRHDLAVVDQRTEGVQRAFGPVGLFEHQFHGTAHAHAKTCGPGQLHFQNAIPSSDEK
jgi:hypothetical protein